MARICFFQNFQPRQQDQVRLLIHQAFFGDVHFGCMRFKDGRSHLRDQGELHLSEGLKGGFLQDGEAATLIGHGDQQKGTKRVVDQSRAEQIAFLNAAPVPLAYDAGDPGLLSPYLLAASHHARKELVAKQAEMVQEIGDMQLAAGRFNSAWGDILKNSDLGYHSEKKAKEWEDKFGERPSKEIMEDWRKRDEELAELKKKLDAAEKRAEEAQAKAAIDAIAEAVARDNNPKKSGRYSGQAKRMAD